MHHDIAIAALADVPLLMYPPPCLCVLLQQLACTGSPLEKLLLFVLILFEC